MNCTLTIVVGLPGSGKDTLLKQLTKETENTFIVSSDEIRNELFGYEDQTQNQKVFEVMNSRVKKLSKTASRVYYNATNINRKRRIALCNEMKKHFLKIEVIVCVCPIIELLERNITRKERHLPEDKLKQMIKAVQIPNKYEYDYDKIIHVYTGDVKKVFTKSDMNKQLFKLTEYNQNNKHHSDTLGIHILKTINGCFGNRLAIEAAKYHDIGKPFCREERKDGNCTYYSHANVSAYEYISYKLGLLSKHYEFIDFSDIPMISFMIEIHDYIFNYNMDFEAMKKSVSNKYNKLNEEFWDALQLLTIADRLR